MTGQKPLSRLMFFLSGSVFLALNFVSNLCELGFNWVIIRLPDGEYSTFGALFRIFFIVTVPVVAVQLVLGKEIAALLATGRRGAAKAFALLSLRRVAVWGAITMVLGFVASPLIADFLHIGTVRPVAYVMLVIAAYFPIPVFYGVIQGMKRFRTLGLVTISWGGGRVLFSVLALAVFAAGLDGIMGAVIAAAIVTAAIAYVSSRSLMRTASEPLEPEEVTRAFSFILPIVLTLFAINSIRGADVIFAKRFFAAADADAYTLAAQVGSAFFTLSSVFMVMIPVVSEERTLRRDPVVFLLRSMTLTGGLSLAGIAVAALFPGLVVAVMTGGKAVPAAEPLVRIVGVAVLFASLSYLIANYLLALHIAGFLPVLLGGAALQVLFINLFHETPFTLVCAVGAANLVMLLGMTGYLVWSRRKHLAGPIRPDGPVPE